MTLNKVAIATTLAMAGGFSTQAHAFLPWAPPAGQTIYEFYESGASATAKSVTELMTEVCKPGSVDTFVDIDDTGTGKTGKKWTSIACQLKNAAEDTNNVLNSTLYDKYVIMNERFKGGSVWGVVPVNFAWYVEFLNPTAATCSETSAGSRKYNCTWESNRATGLVAGPDDQECPTDNQPATTDRSTKCRVSHMGVSDVNPNGFIGPNLPNGWEALTAANNILDVSPGFGVVFGVSVTEIAYRNLQADQGLATYGSNSNADIQADTNFPTDWSDAARPNLSKGEITSLLKGDIKNWADIGLTAASGGFGEMAVCRRVVGSGTQASQNAYFMENPCRTGPLGGAEAMVDESKTDGTSYFVIENSGSGDVIDCQNAAYSGDAFGGKLPGFGLDAIGFNAVEKLPVHTGPAADQDHWGYVKINMQSPTTDNAVNGNYDHFYENTLQNRNTLGTAAEPNTTVQLAMAQMFRNNAGQPRFMDAAGLGGVMALCTADTSVPAFPQSSVTKKGAYCGVVSTCP